MELLRVGQERIQALGFSAADGDEAIAAFETFGRAVTKVVQSPSKEDDEFLEAVDHKVSILRFLLDFDERQRKYRSRVCAVLTRLLCFDSWRAAARTDASLRAGAREVVTDTDATTVVAEPDAVAVDLPGAAADAMAHGAAGAIYVRVVAGHGLVSAGSCGSDAYVRVTVDGRTRQTEVIDDCLDPRWEAAPFVLEVPSFDAVVQFDVLHNDFVKDIPLGSLALAVVDMRGYAKPSTRHSLTGVEHGELELEIAFASAGTRPSHDGSTAAAAPDEPWAVWVSVDPRNSQLLPYTGEVAGALEDAWWRGDSCVELGGALSGALVELRPRLVQRTQKGSRDVRRLGLPRPGGVVRLAVAWGTDWRAAGDVAAPEAEVRQLSVPPGAVVRAGGGAGLRVAAAESTPLGGACTPGVVPTALPPPRGQWVVWLSVDPRSSQLQLYPPELAQRLEAAWRRGDEVLELGEDFHGGATVQLRPKLLQRTAKGSRDVCRVKLAGPDGPAAAMVVKSTDWRAAAGADVPGAEERQASVPPHTAIEVR